jgi:hypothetical protein
VEGFFLQHASGQIFTDDVKKRPVLYVSLILFDSFWFQGPIAEHESLSLPIWPGTSPAGILLLPTINILHTFKNK